MRVTSTTQRCADTICHSGLKTALLVRSGRVQMACKALRLGEDLQAPPLPATSSVIIANIKFYSTHSGFLMLPFPPGAHVYLGPDGCSHWSRLTRKLTAPAYASQSSLGCLPSSPKVTVFGLPNRCPTSCTLFVVVCNDSLYTSDVAVKGPTCCGWTA